MKFYKQRKSFKNLFISFNKEIIRQPRITKPNSLGIFTPLKKRG